MIPKISETALKEAISQAISKKVLYEMPQEEGQDHINKYLAELEEKQPILFDYLVHNVIYLQKVNDGYMPADLLPIHVGIIINALYIQAEIDGIEKLFDMEEKE